MLVAALQEFKHSYRADKARGCPSVQVVEPISDTLHRRKREFVQPAEDPILNIFVCNENGFAVVLAQEAKEVIQQAGNARDLRGDLHEHKESLGFFPMRLLFCLMASNSNRYIASTIGCLSEPVRNDAQNRSGQNRYDAGSSSPSLPFRNAGLSQPPTLAKRLQHAHSLIPLRTHRHSATAPQRAEAATHG